MAKIIAIHSFRGGTGKSNITANVAALLAAEGYRVGVIDADIQSPGIHVLFGMAGEDIRHSLNDYLWGRCDIQQAVQDVTPNLGLETTGRVFLIPSSIKAGEITRVLREGYNAKLLTRGLRSLIQVLNLDVLAIDTHPGLNEETLLSIVISHVLAIILRPDQQDYEGTGVAIEVARQLNVPRILLLVNKVPPILEAGAVQAQVEDAYGYQVAAVLPHSDDLMTLASGGIFAMRYPDHQVTALYKQAATRLVA
jgi:septum site-determining protein MinD